MAVINAIIQSIESVMKSLDKGKGDWRSMDLSKALYSIVSAIWNGLKLMFWNKNTISHGLDIFN